ncbi:nucleotidyltransferase [Metamycoplasma buccale]|uniref:nucleotidyltransferase n=1 Tax=Metamycoplasma buccale TaxID=55602 RepID=UPI00398E5FD0
MKIGLIAEFNPFHNGHKYLIKKIKENFPNSKLIVALSCDYVQRGEIAVASFEDRKKIAMENGVDEVYELDFYTSTQAAHIFAKGAIDLLLSKRINILAFGVSDTNNVNKYIDAANAIKSNIEKYNLNLKKFLKEGRSFVYSSFESLKILIKEEDIPEDILGFEYVKYIVNNNLPIVPFCVKRTVSHLSENVNGKYASATFLRKMISEGKDISEYSPMKIINSFTKIENKYSLFQNIVRNTKPEELEKIMLMSEGMENLFKKNIDLPTYEEFVNACTSRRYTNSRIKRVILYTILGIKKVD